MRILALDGASAAGAGFGVVEQRPEGLQMLVSRWETGQGAAVRLPALLADAFGAGAGTPDLVAVLTGPGSFTGLRATLALAHGIAAGFGIAVVGVSVGEAMAPGLAAGMSSAGPIWCVSQARRDRVFIEAVDRDGVVGAPMALGLEALPDPVGGVPILAGDAQAVAGEVLAARGLHWQAGPLRPDPVEIAAAALRRRDGVLPPRDAQPLYVDPPEAKPSQIASRRQ